MREFYLFVVSRQGSALLDSLESAGISSEHRKGSEKQLPVGELFVIQDEKLNRGKIWLLTGWMDPREEARLNMTPGIIAWRRIKALARRGRRVARREVVLAVPPGDWIDVLATLVSHGFQPIKERDDSPLAQDGTAVLHLGIAADRIFLRGHTELFEQEIKSITDDKIIGIWDVQRVVPVSLQT